MEAREPTYQRIVVVSVGRIDVYPVGVSIALELDPAGEREVDFRAVGNVAIEPSGRVSITDDDPVKPLVGSRW